MFSGSFLVLLKALVKCLVLCLFPLLVIFPSEMDHCIQDEDQAVPPAAMVSCNTERVQKVHGMVVERQTYPTTLLVLVSVQERGLLLGWGCSW